MKKEQKKLVYAFTAMGLFEIALSTFSWMHFDANDANIVILCVGIIALICAFVISKMKDFKY